MTPLEMLRTMRIGYPTLMSPAQLGALLNAVAWAYRDQGMALLGKPGGNNVPAPSGALISSDFLVHVPSRTGHDVLTDNGTSTEPATRNGIILGFEWGPGPEDLSAPLASGARTIVFATDPGAVVLPGDPKPPGPGPMPADDLDRALLHATASLLEQLEARVEVHRLRMEAINTRFDADVAKLQLQIDGLNKAAAPAVKKPWWQF
jgi:hypothetical protein